MLSIIRTLLHASSSVRGPECIEIHGKRFRTQTPGSSNSNLRGPTQPLLWLGRTEHRLSCRSDGWTGRRRRRAAPAAVVAEGRKRGRWDWNEHPNGRIGLGRSGKSRRLRHKESGRSGRHFFVTGLRGRNRIRILGSTVQHFGAEGLIQSVFVCVPVERSGLWAIQT
jgi:hypothetical protein